MGPDSQKVPELPPDGNADPQRDDKAILQGGVREEATTDESNLIGPRESTPATSADATLSLYEKLQLTPSLALKYQQHQLEERLDRDLERLRTEADRREAEIARLRPFEVANAAESEGHRVTKLVGTLSAIAVVIGTAFISNYANTDKFWCGFGWALTIFAVAIQLIICFRT